MPEKHPNTRRWGGPGASHEDATKPMPEPAPAHPPGAVSTNPAVSQVSGGGGELDEKHSHVDNMRSAKSHATDSPSPTSTREWRPNRSRRSREAAARKAAGIDANGSEPETDDGPPLSIQVNTDDHIKGSDRLTEAVEAQLQRSLARFKRQMTRIEVFLSDDNGRKSGPGDKRCSIEARPRGRAPVAATHTGTTIEEAVGGAASKLTRLLDTEFGRLSDHKGRESIRHSP